MPHNRLVRQLQRINLRLLNAVTFLLGIVLTILGWGFITENTNFNTVMLSLGTSIVATSIIAFLNVNYTAHQFEISELVSTWRLEGLFETRAEMNDVSNDALAKLEKELDIAAFGLKQFRQTQEAVLVQRVRAGARVRILAPSPDSDFVRQREKEENEPVDQIASSIRSLIAWKNGLPSAVKDNIRIKIYDAMPLDFYFRIDDLIFLGPYLHGLSSQQTPSMSFSYGGVAYRYYTGYFDRLWNDPAFGTLT